MGLGAIVEVHVEPKSSNRQPLVELAMVVTASVVVTLNEPLSFASLTHLEVDLMQRSPDAGRKSIDAADERSEDAVDLLRRCIH